MLGTASPTELLGHLAEIHAPRLAGNGYAPVLVQPSVLSDKEDELDYSDGTDPEDDKPTSPWGWPTEWDGTTQEAAFAVAQVVVTFQSTDGAVSADAVGRVVRGFQSWFLALKDWIEVLTHQDLDAVAPRRRVEVEGHNWAAWQGHETLKVPWRLLVDFDYGEPLSLERWQRVLRLAGEGSEPPTEHLLLRDARAAHVRAQYRRAVVDAATALEIALYGLLLGAQASAPGPLADELIRSARKWTLGTLRATVERVYGLPSSITEDLVTLRNDVVHKSARRPTEPESAAMLAAATDAVGIANPIDPTL